MTTIKWRAISAIVLAAALAIVFWLKPDLEPEVFGWNPKIVWGVLFTLFWLYLVVQGYPVAHGNIGTSSSHNLDNIISGVPAIVAVFGIFINLLGFWQLSHFNIVIAVMALLVAVYDLWVLGGAASKINRLTDEIKSER